MRCRSATVRLTGNKDDRGDAVGALRLPREQGATISSGGIPRRESQNLAPDRRRHVSVIVQGDLADELETGFRPVPLSQVMTGGREFLYAVVVGIHHEDIASAVHGHARGLIELPWARTGSSPCCE